MKLIAAVVAFVLSHAHVTAGGLAVPLVSPLTVVLLILAGCAGIAVALVLALRGPRCCPRPHYRAPAYVITGVAR